MNRVLAPGVPPIDCLQVLLQSRSITASKFAWSESPNASPNSHHYGLQAHFWVHLISASECISKLTWLQPPRASLSSLDLGLQVHLQTHSIMASKCIWVHSVMTSNCISKFYRSWPPCASEFTRCLPPSASLHSLDDGLKLHLWVHSISASKSISKLNRLWPPIASLSSLNRHFQAHLKLVSITACSQSRYIVCRFGSYINTLIHWYIDENTNWIHKFSKSLNDK